MRKRDLERAAIRLRKFCHDKSCKEILVCPRSHVKCRGRLNVFTAIAWKAAECIDEDSYYWRKEKNLIKLHRLDSLYEVLELTIDDYDNKPEQDDIIFLEDIIDRLADHFNEKVEG